MASKTVGVYISNELLEKIDGRSDNRSGTIEKDLGRLYYMIEYELAELSKKFSVEEYCLIVDALNGTMFSPWSIKLLYAQIEDAVNYDKASRKWRVKGQELIEKLKDCSYGQLLAIVDAAERFWNTKPEEQVNIQELIKTYFLMS